MEVCCSFDSQKDPGFLWPGCLWLHPREGLLRTGLYAALQTELPEGRRCRESAQDTPPPQTFFQSESYSPKPKLLFSISGFGDFLPPTTMASRERRPVFRCGLGNVRQATLSLWVLYVTSLSLSSLISVVGPWQSIAALCASCNWDIQGRKGL